MSSLVCLHSAKVPSTNITVFALINFCTMVPVNIAIRERREGRRDAVSRFDMSAFRDLPFMLMAGGMFFAFWGIYFAFYFMVSYARSVLNMSPTNAINLLVAMNASNLIGRFLPNYISDACIGPLNTIIPSTFFSALMLFLWIGAATPTSLYLIASMYGFAAAGLQSLYTTTIFSFIGNDRTRAASRMALVFVVIGIACLTGAPVGGALVARRDADVDDQTRYLYAQIFAGTSMMVGGGLLFAARVVKSGMAARRV